MQISLQRYLDYNISIENDSIVLFFASVGHLLIRIKLPGTFYGLINEFVSSYFYIGIICYSIWKAIAELQQTFTPVVIYQSNGVYFSPELLCFEWVKLFFHPSDPDVEYWITIAIVSVYAVPQFTTIIIMNIIHLFLCRFVMHIFVVIVTAQQLISSYAESWKRFGWRKDEKTYELPVLLWTFASTTYYT